MAAAIAVYLAELGWPVVLVSADTRSSLGTILNEEIGYDESAGLKRLGETEQYKGLRLGVIKESPYFDNIPGTPLMKAMMRLIAQQDRPTYLVIDAPPTGNLIKNLNTSLPSDDFIWEIIYKINLWQLKRKGKAGVVKYLEDKREAFVKGLNIMRWPNTITIPVTLPTESALIGTNNLISELYQLEVHPYNVLLEDDYTIKDTETGKVYDFTKPVIVNRVTGNSNINKIKEYFPSPEYKTTIVPELDEEPIGRKALSKLGRMLFKGIKSF